MFSWYLIHKITIVPKAFKIYNKNSENLNSLENLSAKYNKNIFIDVELKEVIEDMTIKSCMDFGEWKELKNRTRQQSSSRKGQSW